jgi:hypothetical protein
VAFLFFFKEVLSCVDRVTVNAVIQSVPETQPGEVRMFNRTQRQLKFVPLRAVTSILSTALLIVAEITYARRRCPSRITFTT